MPFLGTKVGNIRGMIVWDILNILKCISQILLVGSKLLRTVSLGEEDQRILSKHHDRTGLSEV